MTYSQAKQMYASYKPEQCLPYYRNVLLEQYSVMRKIHEAFKGASELLEKINCSRNYFSTDLVEKTKTTEYDASTSVLSTIDYIRGRSRLQSSEQVYIRRTLQYDHLKGIISLNDQYFYKDYPEAGEDYKASVSGYMREEDDKPLLVLSCDYNGTSLTNFSICSDPEEIKSTGSFK